MNLPISFQPLHNTLTPAAPRRAAGATRYFRISTPTLATVLGLLAVVGAPIWIAPLPAAEASSEPAELARGGEARMPVVIGAGANEQVRSAAEDLAAYLEKISGASFEIREGTGSEGIVVGLPEDFSELPFEQDFADGPFERDQYRLRSTGNALYLLGATPQAVEFAVWDTLYRMGHRQFFPHPKWEVIPEREKLAIEVDDWERPSYYNRSGPRGAIRNLNRPWLGDAWKNWRIRNRTTPTFKLHTGHMYTAVMRRNREIFDEHPEFYAKVKGERKRGTKFCIGNEDLRELVVEDTIRQVEKNPDVDSISLDPSDGGGWCGDDCEKCAPLGSVSDRVVLLTNQVAEALEEHFDRPYFIGIYAYNDYSPPPSIDVHPNVIVSLATAFIRGGQTFDEMLAGWSEKTNQIGIREYYGVGAWNSSIPGRAKASRIDDLRRTIPEFHAKGARFMNAESDAAWGPNGLGYYLAARMLWDVDESERIDELVEDFVEKAFGTAKAPMREFYDLLTTGPKSSEHLIGTMYRLLRDARSQTDDPRVLDRIDDLILYTRYAELERRFAFALPEERQQAFDDLMSFVWRTRETMLVDSLAVVSYMSRLEKRFKELEWAEGKTKVTPSDIHRVDENKPVTEAEILGFLEDGIASNKTLDFSPVEYSQHLVPAAVSQSDRQPSLSRKRRARTRGRIENYTWIKDPRQPITLKISTGLIYKNHGSAHVMLEQWDEDHREFEEIQSVEVPPDREWHTVELTPEREGLHRIVWKEGASGTRVHWPEDLPRTTPSGPEHTNRISGRDSWYFYVPLGTRVVGMYANAKSGTIRDANGEMVHDFDESFRYRDHLSIEVPEGQDGRLWSVRGLAGRLQLLTVPPFGAEDAENLLLPTELVEKDNLSKTSSAPSEKH